MIDENGIFSEENVGRYVLVFIEEISQDPFSFYDLKSQGFMILEDDNESKILIDRALRLGFPKFSIKEVASVKYVAAKL